MIEDEPVTDAAALPPRRLRIQHISVHPVLVWDDGEEITAGPELQAVTVPLSAARALLDQMPAEVARLAERIAAAPESDPRT